MQEELLKQFLNHQTINVTFDWETYQYLMCGEEVHDVCTHVKMKAVVPVITFIELIELICLIKAKGYTYTSDYVRAINPLHSYNPVMGYFDKLQGNILTLVGDKRFYITLFWLEEIYRFAVIRVERPPRHMINQTTK